MKAKYLNPFTDFGFKKIFGEEASKPQLISFLNSILPHLNIIDLSFKPSEQVGKNVFDRKAIYDLYCQTKSGERIIVEIQKAKQNYFIDRSVFYSTFPIQEQAQKGDWNFKLDAVYCIGILDFTFKETENKTEYLHTAQLKDQHGKVFYDKLTYIYIEMPNFTKALDELETNLEKWLYFIQHLEDFENIPKLFEKDIVFIDAFTKAELGNLDRTAHMEYENSLKVYRDLKNVIDTATDTGVNRGYQLGKMEGIMEGKMEEKIKIAQSLKKMGMSSEIIIQATGLTKEEIEKIEILNP